MLTSRTSPLSSWKGRSSSGLSKRLLSNDDMYTPQFLAIECDATCRRFEFPLARRLSMPARNERESCLTDGEVDGIEREGATVHVDELTVLHVLRVVDAFGSDVPDVPF